MFYNYGRPCRRDASPAFFMDTREYIHWYSIWHMMKLDKKKIIINKEQFKLIGQATFF